MSISDGIVAGFAIGLIVLGLAALVCWIDVRKAHGKPVLPRIRRQKAWWRMKGPMPQDGSISDWDATTWLALVDLIKHGTEAAEPQYKEGQL